MAGVVRSAAYNATVTLGAAALVRPLNGVHVLWPAFVAAVLPLALAVVARRRSRLRWPLGVVLVAGYLAAFGGFTLR